jgi:hypothetical protein
MRNCLLRVTALSLGLLACGGSAEEAKSAADPWADFKGTYSTPAAAPHSAKGEAPKKDKAKAKAAPVKEEVAIVEEAPPAPAPATKKTSKGTVNGESLSSISVDALTNASKSTLNKKFVSNSVVTGSEYEVVEVELKGVKVQIVRPAESPAPSGPALTSPKAKKASLGKTDAAWYDEEADVLILVTSPKKGAAQKALNAIVKH